VGQTLPTVFDRILDGEDSQDLFPDLVDPFEVDPLEELQDLGMVLPSAPDPQMEDREGITCRDHRVDGFEAGAVGAIVLEGRARGRLELQGLLEIPTMFG
jgi:hypothetical protein